MSKAGEMVCKLDATSLKMREVAEMVCKMRIICRFDAEVRLIDKAEHVERLGREIRRLEQR